MLLLTLLFAVLPAENGSVWPGFLGAGASPVDPTSMPR